MSPRSISATDWVRQLPRGARIHWAELEAHVFHRHRKILRLLGPAGDAVRLQGRGFALVSGALILIACIIGLATVWAPIWGLATLAGDAWGVEDVDGSFAIPVAGLAMFVSAVVQLTMLVRRSLHHGAGGTDDASVAGGTIVLAVLTLVGIVTVGVRQQPDGWELWLLPALIGLGLAVINLVAARRPSEAASARDSRKPRSPHSPADGAERRRSAIAALPARERDDLIDDQRAAISALRMRGTITPDEAERATRAELGMLSTALADHDPL